MSGRLDSRRKAASRPSIIFALHRESVHADCCSVAGKSSSSLGAVLLLRLGFRGTLRRQPAAAAWRRTDLSPLFADRFRSVPPRPGAPASLVCGPFRGGFVVPTTLPIPLLLVYPP